jgi:serine/threonine-protein kinase
LIPAGTGIREGDVVAGKYRVERLLGAGGMGVVVAARHLQLDEKVALKFLLPEALANTEAVARFAREARAAVRIKNEHVARVLDVGTLPNGAPYLVMEYLEGIDLATWLRERGVLDHELAVRFVLQACVAVADAHALGIVHRDLKPANLFCVQRSDGRPSIKVLDFGISKMTDGSAHTTDPVTRTSSLIGSPLYMSPEQMRSSKNVDARADIWALGMILFELVTGRAAFLADSVTELAIKIATEPAPGMRELRSDVPSELEAVVLKCLAKDPLDRPANVAELARALVPFAPKATAAVERISGIIDMAGLSATAPAHPAPVRVPASGVGSTQASAGALPALGRTTAGAARSKRLGVLGGAALVAIAATAMGLRRAFVTPVAPRTGAATASAAPSDQGVLAESALVIEAPHHEVADAAPVQAQAAVVPTSTVQAAKRRPANTAPALSPAPSPPTATPTPNCDPPYYFNAEGNHVYKRECM